MISHIERHEQLIAAGWTTRIDGLLKPPAHWPDQRPRTAQAAWHDHTTAQTEHQPTERTAP